ncbi:MAG: orotidine-5'-phosphate decarboxylase [Candidatus Gracilibacteria bacterium]
MNFADKLIAQIRAKNSVVCVGLDPQLSKLPKFLVEKMRAEYGDTLKAGAEAFLAFNKAIIDAVKDFSVAVKPQIAFYEELGFEGVRAFEETCKYASEAGLIVIVDAKRNDIGSTAEAYAHAFLSGTDLFGKKVFPVIADALTVNAYLGLDGIAPFLKACGEVGKGIFVLVRTSNPSSGDLQARVTVDENMTIAELMGHFVESWGGDLAGDAGYSAVGAVVGATYPKEAQKLRSIMPSSFFLLPGFGAQGATADDTAPAFDKDGLGALVVSARGIIYAFAENGAMPNGENFAEIAREASLKMRDELNVVRLSR